MGTKDGGGHTHGQISLAGAQEAVGLVSSWLCWRKEAPRSEVGTGQAGVPTLLLMCCAQHPGTNPDPRCQSHHKPPAGHRRLWQVALLGLHGGDSAFSWPLRQTAGPRRLTSTTPVFGLLGPPKETGPWTELARLGRAATVVQCPALATPALQCRAGPGAGEGPETPPLCPHPLSAPPPLCPHPLL